MRMFVYPGSMKDDISVENYVTSKNCITLKVFLRSGRSCFQKLESGFSLIWIQNPYKVLSLFVIYLLAKVFIKQDQEKQIKNYKTRIWIQSISIRSASLVPCPWINLEGPHASQYLISLGPLFKIMLFSHFSSPLMFYLKSKIYNKYSFEHF